MNMNGLECSTNFLTQSHGRLIIFKKKQKKIVNGKQILVARFMQLVASSTTIKISIWWLYCYSEKLTVTLMLCENIFAQYFNSYFAVRIILNSHFRAANWSMVSVCKLVENSHDLKYEANSWKIGTWFSWCSNLASETELETYTSQIAASEIPKLCVRNLYEWTSWNFPEIWTPTAWPQLVSIF